MDLSSVWNVFLFVIGFGSLIFVHELGHFLVAKWVGVKVTQFAIGFGHAVLCYRKGIGYRVGTTEPEYQRRIEQFIRDKRASEGRADDNAEITTAEIEHAGRELGLGETEYRLNWMPFGGYVKMVGQEDLDPKATSDDPRSFNNKPIWARMCVISAGVVMNVIFAVIFFMVAFMVGVAFPPAIVGDVAPGSPAANAAAVQQPDVVGLRPGDRIVAINGEPTTDFLDVRIASALGRRDQVINLDVERPQLDGSTQQLRFAITPQMHDEEQLLHIGVAPAASLRLVDAPQADALLEPRGLEPGMRLTAVNGQPVDEHWQYRRLLREAEGKPLELTFESPARRNQEAESKTITLRPQTQFMFDEGSTPHLLGLIPATRIEAVASGSAAEGVLQAGDIIRQVGDYTYPGTQQISQAVQQAGSQALTVTVIRDGETVTEKITPRGGRLGIQMTFADATIRGTVPESPFGELDLPPGTRITEVGGEPIASLGELRRHIQSNPDAETLAVTYRLPVGDIIETAELTLSEADRTALAELAWTDNLPFEVLEVPQVAGNPAEAIWMGIKKTNSFMVQTYITINRLFVGTVQVEHLRGPVGIVESGTQFSQRGFGYLMFFLGLISINLAVINFLPLPIVDGGLALLLLWEKIRGRPAPPEVQSALTVIGLLLIGTLFITVTYYDFARLFGGG